MASYEPESLEAADSQHLIFGHDDSDDGDILDSPAPDAPRDPRRTRRQRHQRRRLRRRRRIAVLLAVLAVAIVVVSGWFIVRPIVADQLASKDYAGAGSGEVQVRVNPGDDASAIAATLKKDGVVRTEGAFTSAAKANPDSVDIQPGVYRMRKHMSAEHALALLLNPSARIVIKVSIPEGTIEKKVVAKLAQALDMPPGTVGQAATDVGKLGLPDGYTREGSASLPTSAEGFLYPDTYNFSPGTSASDALQQMVHEFTLTDRRLKFASAAKRLHVTPYQALTIASMIEAEAKFPSDRAKVARVVFNRMAKKMPLGIDATSIYGAEIAGKDPSKIDYDAPAKYNTRHSSKLPPTPIGNPGSASLTAAVHPAKGQWLYYVNGDAAGHLAFFADQTKWAAAVKRCQDNHWGCS